MKNISITALVVILLVSGCSSVSTIRILDADRLAAVETKFQNQATIYLFRGSSRAGSIWTFPVTLDGKEVGSVRREQFIVFPVNSGPHQISITCASICELPGFLVDADFTSGKSYYFLIEPDTRFSFSEMSMSTSIMQVDKPFAERLLRTYKLGKQVAY